MKEARYYESHPRGVQCTLCPKQCVIPSGQSGFCRVRRHVDGVLYAVNYGACTACALDPIEKKPLYHFYPGSLIYSIGTWGCNFSCRFCQNWHIAHADPPIVELAPYQAVREARHSSNATIGIAYTYSEPCVWFEYVLDCARLARAEGLKNVLVTNGFISIEPLKELLPYIDAMNIDVKAFTEEFYRQICAGCLADVKRVVEVSATACHVEVTTLLVPGLNDSAEEVRQLAAWLGGIRRDIPLHLTRYFPQYQLESPPTTIAALERGREAALPYVDYVYIGNVGGRGMNTYCPGCGFLVIERTAGMKSSLTADKQCPGCGQSIAITGEVKI